MFDRSTVIDGPTNLTPEARDVPDGWAYADKWSLRILDHFGDAYELVYQFHRVKGFEEADEDLPWHDARHVVGVYSITALAKAA